MIILSSVYFLLLFIFCLILEFPFFNSITITLIASFLMICLTIFYVNGILYYSKNHLFLKYLR